MSGWPDPAIVWPETSAEVDSLRAQVIDLTRRNALLAAAAAPQPVESGLVERTIVEALQPIVGHDLALGCAEAVRGELAEAGLTIVIP